MHQKTTTTINGVQQGEPYQLHFYYDKNSRPMMVRVGNDEVECKYYSYIHNLQGDILGIIDKNQELAVKYTYDPWGQVLESRSLKTEGEKLTELNPFRYKGYIYDTDTKLFYVGSRYYDSEIGRWLNADDTAVLIDTKNHWGKNLFAYCDNNPVNRIDPTGEAWWDWVVSGASIIAGAALCATGVGSVVGVGLIVGGTSGLISNVMDAAGVDSKLASQISAGIDIVGGTVLLFTPFAPVGASMIGSGAGSFAGGYISEGLGGSYALGSMIGSIGGGVLGGKIADVTSTKYLNNLVRNPSAIQGQTLTRVKMASNLSSQYNVGVMQRSTSAPLGGFTSTNKTNVSLGYIQYHPGTPRHFGGAPYWKITSSFNKAARFPYR